MRADELIGNGLPTLQYASSEPYPDTPPFTQSASASLAAMSGRPKKKKKRKSDIAPPWTLLYHMNNNIKTMRKVRTTHAKFAALSQTNEDGSVQPVEFLPPPTEDVEEVIDERPWKTRGSGMEMGAEHADACLHWAGSKILEHAGFQGEHSFSVPFTQ